MHIFLRLYLKQVNHDHRDHDIIAKLSLFDERGRGGGWATLGYAAAKLYITGWLLNKYTRQHYDNKKCIVRSVIEREVCLLG